ncbi:MAG: hypothetical protein Q8R01_14950 [Ramlibacter sp.]|nr:hypothetical protein [Ramlibacter sp.]
MAPKPSPSPRVEPRPVRLDRIGLLCAGAVCAPGSAAWLESAMLSHMLVQIPVLVTAGFLVGTHWRRASNRVRALGRAFRWPLVATAGGTLMLWMIPRLLDEAVASPVVDAVKLASLFAAAGVPLGLGWPELGPVARGVIHVEALSTCWRLGWLYLDTPQRLCSQYLLDDQYRVGTALLLLGVPYAANLAALALFGPRLRGPRAATEH